jgi:hypothetical protein
MKPIFVHNNIIPFGRFTAMAFYPFIFIKKKLIKGSTLKRTVNHEKIHLAQQREMFLVFFYLYYGYWWIKYGYRNIPFEREAYAKQDDKYYLRYRKDYAFLDYL